MFGKMKYNQQSVPQRKRRDAVVRWVAHAMRPLSVVEDQAFIDLCRTLDPAFIIPSRTTVRNRVISLYDDVFAELVKLLKPLWEVWPALTTDAWTSTANDGYMSLTMHYITPDFTLVDHGIAVFEFPPPHNATRTAERTQNIMDSLGMPEGG